MTEQIIFNISQVVTCTGKRQAKRGTEMWDVGFIENGAVDLAHLD